MSTRPYTLYVMVTAFFVMYLFQGLFFGYVNSLTILLKAEGFSYSQVSLLNLSSIPFYLKCFFSPFLDKVFSVRLGKRMTYISIFSVLIVASYLFLAAGVSEWIDQKQVTVLAGSLIFTMFLIAVQDLAIDALAEEIFTRNDVKFGPITQSVGQIIGPLISFNLFMFLNDKVPNLNFLALLVLAGFVTCGTLFVFFYIREKPSESEFESVFDIFLVFPKFIKNRYVRSWFLFIFSAHAPRVFFSSTITLVFIDKGLPKETLSHIALPALVSALVCSFMVGKFKLDVKTSFRILRLIHVATFFVLLGKVLVYFRFDPETNLVSTIRWLYVIGMVEGLSYAAFVVRANFNNLMCDNSISCTYLAVLGCLSNLARLFLVPVYTMILDYVSYRNMSLFMLSYHGFYMFMIFPKFVKFFTPLGKRHFKIVDSENEKEKGSAKEKKVKTVNKDKLKAN